MLPNRLRSSTREAKKNTDASRRNSSAGIRSNASCNPSHMMGALVGIGQVVVISHVFVLPKADNNAFTVGSDFGNYRVDRWLVVRRRVTQEISCVASEAPRINLP